MSIVRDMIEWAADTHNFANQKFRTPRKAPPYVATEIGSLDTFGVPQSWYADWSFEKQQRAATNLSWIYSNIVRIGNEVSAASFNVYERGTNEKDIDHPFERLMAFPNKFFDGRSY